MKDKATEIIELETVASVDAFCEMLQEWKREAPVSLRLLVAVTAIRDVEYVGGYGNGNMVGPTLQQLQKSVKDSMVIVEPVQQQQKLQGKRRARPSSVRR